MLCGTVTTNGLFVVVVEEGMMRLLRLQGSYEGGLTCLSNPIEWSSALKPAAAEVLAVSVSVKEELGRLHITGVDGRGHALFARVSVRNMPAPERPFVQRLSVAEASAEHPIYEVASSSGGSRRSQSTTQAREYDQDMIEVVPG